MQGPNCQPESLPLSDLLDPVASELERVTTELVEDLSPGNAEVVELVDHVAQYRGKQLRPALSLLWGKATGRLAEAHFTVAKVVEMIHLATLVHDDVLDGADVRRRVATLNALHGNEVPVLLGDYIYARAFHLSVMMEDLTCSRTLAEVTRLMCQGEITQILHRFDFEWSERRYFDVIREKTATLYGAACSLGVHYAGGPRSLADAAERYGERLGIAFQIVDDCLDLDGDESVVGKSLGTDVQRGKLTLPLLLMMRDAATADRLRRLMRSADEAALARLRSEFDLEEAIDRALAVAREHAEAAVAELAALPPGAEREALAGIGEFVVRRRR